MDSSGKILAEKNRGSAEEGTVEDVLMLRELTEAWMTSLVERRELESPSDLKVRPSSSWVSLELEDPQSMR